jgi:hypothetical protein
VKRGFWGDGRRRIVGGMRGEETQEKDRQGGMRDER